VTVVRVALPSHLRNLAKLTGEAQVEVVGEPTLGAVLEALEASHPALLGTIRDRETGQRRAFMRFFACGRDLSLESLDAPLPGEVAAGSEALRIVGAIAGG